MNTKRSYLDTLNDGRPRRPQASLDELSKTLERLENQLQANQRARRETTRDDGVAGRMQRLSSEFAPAPRGRRDAYEPDRSQAPQRQRDTADTAASFNALAREMERSRDEHDGFAAVTNMAEQLKGLREEIHDQVTGGLRREFEEMRSDIAHVFGNTAASTDTELSAELERLSVAIGLLAERGDERSAEALRQEMAEIKTSLRELAREETLAGVERRLDKAAPDLSDSPGFQTLSQRLDEISTTLRDLPESLPVRSLEEKVRTLAGAIDHFSRQDTVGHAPQLRSIEERLDEISRAIVASAVTPRQTLDTEPFERIEARIVSIARQIEEIADQNPVKAVMGRLNELSARVDEIGARAHMPEEAVERVSRQVAKLAERIEQTPAMPDAEMIVSGLERRFAQLSEVFDRRQSDAVEQGQALFRELEGRLESLAGRIDRASTAAAEGDAAMMDVIDARFAEFSERLESSRVPALEAQAMRGLEMRLADIADQIDASNRQSAGLDAELIQNLERKIVGLSANLDTTRSTPELDEIAPRLATIERSIVENREAIIRAARDAAEQAVRTLGTDANSPAIAELASDLKSLETLTLKADERNGRTFEAIHDTLLKIVDRLANLEHRGPVAATAEALPAAAPKARERQRDVIPSRDVPALDLGDVAADLAAAQDAAAKPETRPTRTASEAAAAAAAIAVSEPAIEREVAEDKPASKSLLGGIARRLSRKRAPKAPDAAVAEPAAPSFEPDVDLDAPLDASLANRPLEPGSGAPDLSAIMKRVRDERGGGSAGNTDAARSDFIAAARRAAQAAAAEASYLKQGGDKTRGNKESGIGRLFSSKRKTALMATTAVILGLGALQFTGMLGGGSGEPSRTELATAAVPATPAASASASATPAASTDDGDDMIAASEGGNDIGAGLSAATDLEDEIGDEPVEVVTLDAEDEIAAADTTTAEPAPAADAMQPMPVAAAAIPMPSTESAAEPSVDDVSRVAVLAEPDLVAPSAMPQPSATEAPSVPMPAIAVPADAGPVALREAAAAGDAAALYEIANRYAEGRGVKSDMATAAEWFRRAADLGLAPAQYRLGNMYEKGLGIARDIPQAKTWYQLAAAQGNASAMHNLAVLHALGADGATDNESAARWFAEAADLGVRDSQFNLGILAAKGVGMKQDLIGSYKWFAVVAKAGDKDAAQKRDEIAKALTEDELAKARATADLWKPVTPKPEANVVAVPDSWRESAGQTASIDMRQAVRNIQVILNENGYDAGAPDGVMGSKTKSAIAAFQAKHDMPATGEVDEMLVKKLLETR